MDMVTAVTSMGRSGLYDWLMQRVTAVILLAYFLYIGGVLLVGDLDYATWKGLHDQTWMRVFSMLALVSLVMHAWVGMWAVLTDYLTERLMGTKGTVLRLLAQAVCGIAMFTYFIWGIQILWGY